MPHDLKKTNRLIKKEGERDLSHSGEQLVSIAGCVVDAPWELLLCLGAGGRWWLSSANMCLFPLIIVFRILNEYLDKCPGFLGTDPNQ